VGLRQQKRLNNALVIAPECLNGGFRLDVVSTRIGFIGKDILALEKKITEPSEIIKQNQGFEISRLLNQQREQEQHPGIDR
jgi:hypothetical protein